MPSSSGTGKVQTLEEFYSATQKRDKNGRWTKVGGGSTGFPNGVNPNTRLEHWNSENQGRLNDPMVVEHARRVKNAVGANPEVRVRVPASKLEQILSDGQLKTQHETGASGGSFSPIMRDQHEANMFGAEKPRPVYGYVKPVIPNVALGEQHWYGGVALVLKREVVDRTTMVVGDSLDIRRPPAPIPLSEVREATPGRILAASTEGRDYIHKDGYAPTVQYLEAQIHGGVSIKDIDHIEVDVNDRRYDSVVSLAAEHGIPVVSVNVNDHGDTWQFGLEVRQSDFFRAPTVTAAGQIWIEEFYDPGQPRDRMGKWTTKGSSTLPLGPSKKMKISDRVGSAAEPTHTPSEFGAKIRDAIANDPVLSKRMTRAEMEAERERLSEERLEQGRNVQRSRMSRNQLDVSVGTPVGGKNAWEMTPEERKADEAARIVLRDQINQRLNSNAAGMWVLNPNREPKDAIDALIGQAVKDRLSGRPDLLSSTSGEIDGRNVVLTARGTTLLKPNIKDVGNDQITPEFEAASTRIGKMIHDEITSRANDIIASRKALYEATMQSIERETGLSRNDLGIMPVSGEVYAKGGGPIATLLEPHRENINKILAMTKIRDMDEKYFDTNNQISAYQAAYITTMREIRSMGGMIDGVPAHKKPRMGLSSHEQVLNATGRYPSDWMEFSNMRGPVSFKQTKGRAHYNDMDALVTLDGSVSTAVHELGHRFETTVPGLAALEQRFYERRTAGEPTQKLSSLVPGHGYRSNEVSRPDDFFDPYAGKVYPDKYFEVFTMGMEGTAMRAGRGKVGEARYIDDDHAAFILGALVTLVPA